MTTKGIIIGLLAALSGLLFISQALLFQQAYRESNMLSKAVEANEVITHFLQASGEWALERGLTHVALNNPAPAGDDTIKKIAQFREAGDQAFLQAMAHAHDAALVIDDTYAKKIDQALAQVKALRTQVDAALKKPKSARASMLVKRWFPTITALIVETQQLRINLSSQITIDDVTLSKDFVIRYSVWVMTEYAGRERAIIGGAIAAHQPLTPAQRQELSEYRGKVEESWNILSSLYLSPGEHAVFDGPIAAIHTDFLDSYEHVRQSIYADSAAGTGYRLSANQWFARATQAIDTMRVVQDVDSKWIAALLKKKKNFSDQIMFGYMLSSLIAVAVVFVFK